MPENGENGHRCDVEARAVEARLLRFLERVLKEPIAAAEPKGPPVKISIKGRGGSFVPFLISQAETKALIFYEEEDEALLLKEELEFFSGRPVYIFPALQDRVFEKDDEVRRASFLYHLITDSGFQGLYPSSALARTFIHPETYRRAQREIAFGDTVFMEDIVAFLEKAGYELVPLVREQGEYARRGSIIDIFPPAYDAPARVEFLGDEILSIRFFDPLSQRSQKEVEEVRLVPFSAPVETMVGIADCIEEGMVVVHYGEEYLARALDASEEAERLKADLFARLDRCIVVDTSGMTDWPGTITVEALSNDDLRQAFRARTTEVFPGLATKLNNEWIVRRYVYLFGQHLGQAERLREIFRTYGVSLPILEKIAPAGKEREWGIVIGPVRRGFRVGEVVLLTEEDIVGPKKRLARRPMGSMDEFLNSFRDLAVGDYVVHVDHGIGVYRGLHELGIGGSRKDFLLIEYLEGDKLYVPVEDFHLVQKYIAGDKHMPKLDRLGSQLWITTKRKVRKQVEEIAGELIRIHAERQVQRGHAFPPADEFFREMESRFPYEETEGQLRAIEDVLSDMESERPMDRLICGDVGFGKTEVALRASFKAVADNKQVVLLVPTTILAQQHYKNFTERLRDYPITVDMLSRFRSRNEQQRTLEGLKKGKVDIVIGTHRLLQKDFAVKDLGLLVIDEEHRFGVKHKEGLKSLKKNVDVLTLSATPIPRTLNMAVTGIKDLSVITTPPLDRLAVKTTVMKFNDGQIRNGIMRELVRGGQVFFMHNFIHNIGVVFNHLTQLVPEVRIAIAHGQMEGRTLEKVMLDFIDGKYDLLLSTNIIESGLDISNVNTIFINNAHRLGLADLYQLRGRVGRSTTQAYAYLLIPREEVLTREARLRLKILEELTELGSGFQIANYDLEIRGAGNLVGTEQSGNINLVGFELFCTMLEEAVRKVRAEGAGEDEQKEVSPSVNLPVDAYIPETYMENAAQKLLTYKRLSRIRTDEELADMEEELKDRYGADLPRPLRNLLSIIGLRIFLARIRVSRVEYGAKRLVIHVSPDTPLNLKRILSLTSEDARRVKLFPDGRIILHTEKTAGELIDVTRNVLMDILAL